MAIRRALLVGVGILLPHLAWARENPFVESRFQTKKAQFWAGITDRPLEEIIGTFIKAALSLAGVFFFAYIVWAGYLWMTAHGEEEKITQAKKMISGGIIGLAITLAAYAITIFVVGRLTAPETGVLQPTAGGG